MNPSTRALVGLDIGGTFTDACAWDGRTLRTGKALTTPDDLVRGVLSAMEQLDLPAGFDVVAGSTVATNALLERKGARTAFVATAGFRDLLRIGRQNRPRLYDLHVRKPAPIVAPEDCLEIAERIDAAGEILTPLADADIATCLAALRERGIDNVAVCLLFAFLNPVHERRLGDALRQAGLTVSLSSEVLPEFREFERGSTTAINAYVGPPVRRYLRKLDIALRERGARTVRVMQSGGGQISVESAGDHAVRTILSGPAGGIVAAQTVGRDVGCDRLVTYDMGGTSTDVALVAGQPAWRCDSVVDGWPVHVPMLDIHTIGAGGGSIARVDEAGALQVGPASAGSDPGPACYGRGTLPTITDAHVVLGRLLPDRFLGGRMKLDAARAETVIDAIAAALGVDRAAAAAGILRVANANMERAVKAVSADRGHDPRPCMLVSFGGAGGLHACELAASLGMRGVVVPAHAGVLSAVGMIQSDIRFDLSRSLPREAGDDLDGLRRLFGEMMDEAAARVVAERYDIDDSVVDRFADMRYHGQSHELTVPVESLTDRDRLAAPFHRAHELAYGHASVHEPVEIVTLRVRCTVAADKPRPRVAAAGDGDPAGAYLGPRPMVFPAWSSAAIEARAYRRDGLRPADAGVGPAVIVEDFATTVIPPGWRWEVSGHAHVVCRPVDADGQPGA